MKNVLISFLMGIIVGGGAVWYVVEPDGTPGLQEIGQRVETAAQNINETGVAAADRAGEILDAQLEALNLDTGKIQEEMARTGEVVRRRARELGAVVADAAADTRITTEIKAALLRDPDLSAWNVSVSTTDGRVTLFGDVTSTAQIGRAIFLAYETPGVEEVTSTLRAQEGS